MYYCCTYLKIEERIGYDANAGGNCTDQRSNMVNARIAAHLSQKKVAEKLKVNVASVINWEKAYTIPYLSQLDGLREAIKFTGTDEAATGLHR